MLHCNIAARGGVLHRNINWAAAMHFPDNAEKTGNIIGMAAGLRHAAA
jgi:hypothetical protein